jgi:serine/threonine-protein kinase
VIGTAHYLAPEQVAGEKATRTSDVYSLGVVAYECLAGRRPFEGENSLRTALKHLREPAPPLPPDVPDDVRNLVARAMARNPAERLPDGAALRDAIGGLSTTPVTTVTGQPTVRLPTGPRRRGRRRRTAAVAAVAALMLLGVVVAGVLAGRSATSSASAARPAAWPTPDASSAPTSRPGIHLAGDGLLGRPVAEVEARLTALGLRVAVRATETGAFPAGAVVGLDPVGDLVAGQWVTLTYATPPVVTPSAIPPLGGSPATPSPSDTAAAPSSGDPGSTQRPGRGHGHGRNR